MVVYRLAMGARPSSFAEFVDPSSLLKTCQVAEVVADTLDPVNGREIKITGMRGFTMWGETATHFDYIPHQNHEVRAGFRSR